MEIARYIDGRPLTYDEGTGSLSIGGSPVTIEQVINYDYAGHLTWVGAEPREWAHKASDKARSSTAAPKRAVADRAPVRWHRIQEGSYLRPRQGG